MGTWFSTTRRKRSFTTGSPTSCALACVGATTRSSSRPPRTETFALMCAYPISRFDDPGYAKPFADINAAHTWVTPAESYSIAKADDRNRVIATLQQKAAALEAESKQRAVLESALRHKID